MKLSDLYRIIELIGLPLLEEVVPYAVLPRPNATDKFHVYKNPPSVVLNEIGSWLKDRVIRGLFTYNHNVYIWDAFEATHDDVKWKVIKDEGGESPFEFFINQEHGLSIYSKTVDQDIVDVMEEELAEIPFIKKVLSYPEINYPHHTGFEWILDN